MLSLVYSSILKINKVLKVTVSIIKVFASLFIYIGNLGTILVAKAIITKVILNSELISINKLVIAGNPKLTALAKSTVNAIAAIKASVFSIFFQVLI
jgi:hypothetical protein